MIEFNAQKPKLSINLDGTIVVSFTTQKNALKTLDELPNDTLFTVTVKKQHAKRTLTQNSYLWVILNEIASTINLSAEEAYKEYIRDFGVFDIIPIKNDAVERFIRIWEGNGIGWFCDDLGESKIDGYTKLKVYTGSSRYDTKQMARIIDAVVRDAEEMGIQCLTASEWALLNNDN